MEEIKKKVAKLIDLKSIITLCLTIVFCVMSLVGVVPQEFLAIYTMIMGFYFGHQSNKKTADEPVAVVAETAVQNTGKAADSAVTNDTHPPDTK